jgi:hypothetical protein
MKNNFNYNLPSVSREFVTSWVRYIKIRLYMYSILKVHVSDVTKDYVKPLMILSPSPFI